MKRLRRVLLTNLVLVLALTTAAAAQTGAAWSAYGGDPGNTRYSTLNQVNAGNVERLKVAWALQLGSLRSQESTPILVGDTLYVTSSHGPKNVFAVNAKTGEVALALLARGPGGHRPVRVLRRQQPRRRPRQRQDLRRPAGREAGRARCQDRQGAVEDDGHRLHAGLGHHLAADGRQESGHHRLRRRRIRRARLLQRIRPGHRQARSGRSTPCRGPASPATTRGRATRGSSGGGVAWLHRLLRCRSRISCTTGPAIPVAMERGVRGNDDSNIGQLHEPLHRIDARHQPRHRQDRVALSSPRRTTPGTTTASTSCVLADLDIGGQKTPVLLKADRNGFFYVLNRETGKLISAEPFVRHQLGQVGRHEHRAARGGPDKRPRPEVPGQGHLPEPDRRQELDADELQPADRARVHPDHEPLHGSGGRRAEVQARAVLPGRRSSTSARAGPAGTWASVSPGIP